jgi:transcriptional regulator with XRE-family HTH domain
MLINELLAEKGMTRYRLAKDSGVPQTTVTDICSGNTKIENCTGGTLYRLAKTLNVTVEALLLDSMEHRPAFETFKSNVCHCVKDRGDMDFIIETLQSDEIPRLWDRKWYAECLYLLAMVDYLCKENELPIVAEYDRMRRARLRETLYPAGVLIMCAALKSDEPKEQSIKEAIPEFLRHNIVESEVRNVA